jgi:hypothetical protein
MAMMAGKRIVFFMGYGFKVIRSKFKKTRANQPYEGLARV